MTSSLRVTIEPLALRHSEELFAALDDPRVGRYLGGPDVTTLAALRARINRLEAGAPAGSGQEWWNFAVLLEGRVIGRLEATLHHDVAEVAYVFGPPWWGQGLATESVGWLMATLAEHGVGEYWATVDPGNQASRRLLQRLGFVECPPSEAPELLSYDPGDLVLRLVAPVGA